MRLPRKSPFGMGCCIALVAFLWQPRGDAQTPPPESNKQFVTGQYYVVLGRAPDAPGWNYWFTQDTYYQDTSTFRSNLTSTFLTSDEYKAKYYVLDPQTNLLVPPDATPFVTHLYDNGFGWEDQSQNGIPYWAGVVTSNDTPATRAGVAVSFIESPSYYYYRTDINTSYCSDDQWPSTFSVSGDGIVGHPQTISAVVPNACGPSDILSVFIHITATTGTNDCWIEWNSTGALSNPSSPATYGCSIAGASASFDTNSNTLTIQGVTFTNDLASTSTSNPTPSAYMQNSEHLTSLTHQFAGITVAHPSANSRTAGNPTTYACSSPYPNSTIGGTSITYTLPTSQNPAGLMSGMSSTYSVGPDVINGSGTLTNFATAVIQDSSGNRLGSNCSGSNPPINYPASSYDTGTAVQYDPCNSNYPPYNSIHYDKFYQLAGQHWECCFTPGGTLTTYYGLGFVPAGGTWTFNNLSEDNFIDYRNVTGPVVLGTDGVTAAYTNRTQTSVSIKVAAPWNATKGQHQIQFPFTYSCGDVYPNQNFGAVVYDLTPVIQSVTPASPPAGSQTLTIQGTGFGSHPTIYVGGSSSDCTGGTAYNPVPTHNTDAQGLDYAIVSPTVTLTYNQSNPSVPICVVSNGVGTQAFFGAPVGSTQGSPRSSPMQITVQAPPSPSISGVSLTHGGTAQSTLQVGWTGVQFTISGSNFGSAAPQVTSPAITNVQVTQSTDYSTSVSGTFDVVTTVLAGSYTLTLTPSGQSQGAAWTIQLVAAPPTISGVNGVWWFGTANDAYKQGYYPATLLTATAGAGGAAPSPSSPVTWRVDADYVQLSEPPCVDSASCGTATLTVVSAPPTTGCPQVHVTATLGGVQSASFTVFVDQPLQVLLYPELAADAGYVGSLNVVGYESENTLRAMSACQQPITNMFFYEQFTAAYGACPPYQSSALWTAFAPPNDNLGVPQTTGGPLDPVFPGRFWDYVGFHCLVGSCVPDPVDPTKNPGAPLSTQVDAEFQQVWWFGSDVLTSNGTGLGYSGSGGFAVIPNYQVRYLDHGRDQYITWGCPPM